MESNEDDVLPPLPLVVEDALALGYDVIVYVIDDEEGHRYWCANTRQYVEAANVPEAGFKLCDGEEWDSAMSKALEEIQGGPLSSIEEIEAEEYHNKRAEEIPEHDTWYDPSKPNDVVPEDSACYCGWLGIDAPPPEFAPPGCNCYEEGDA